MGTLMSTFFNLQTSEFRFAKKIKDETQPKPAPVAAPEPDSGTANTTDGGGTQDPKDGDK